jgi:hypothetical protein
MLNRKKESLLIFLGGTAGGICLSVIIGLVLLTARVQTSPRPTPMPMPTTIISTASSQDYIASPTTTPAKQATPLDEAEEALKTGQPEKVRDLLFPMIESWTSNNDRVRGYKLLGEAELAQGHAQLAVPYFEKLYFYEPTAENLYFLATTYDIGGDIRNALVKYQELANWENLPPEIDREFLLFRIDDIRRSLGTPSPDHRT